jgi:hypothetical protein
MSITPFLGGLRLEPETKRVMGIAFAAVCAALKIEDWSGPAARSVANWVIGLAILGERNPDRLCELTLIELRSGPAGR